MADFFMKATLSNVVSIFVTFFMLLHGFLYENLFMSYVLCLLGGNYEHFYVLINK